MQMRRGRLSRIHQRINPHHRQLGASETEQSRGGSRQGEGDERFGVHSLFFLKVKYKRQNPGNQREVKKKTGM